MTEKEFYDLIERYTDGTATQQERNLLDCWYLKKAAGEMETRFPEDLQSKMDRALPLILANEQFYPKQPVIKKKLWPTWAVAASVAMAVFAGSYFYYQSRTKDKTEQVAVNDILPGKNGATLTLANGKKIYINDAVAGNIAEQSGVKISKSKDGHIIYEITNDNSGKVEYNTLSTTRGEQTQVRLPDGSLVFLNAMSSLKYPTSFTGQEKRNVVLTGEGYFEISKDKTHPFTVNTKEQLVEVLGTHFNVNAYTNNVDVKTTLLEGRVKVSNNSSGLAKILDPGQQSIVTNKTMIVKDVEAEDAVGWKNGRMIYDGETLENIMKDVSRWYNVEVIYRDESIKEKTFFFSVSRRDKVSKILKILMRTQTVSCNIDGNKIIIEKR